MGDFMLSERFSTDKDTECLNHTSPSDAIFEHFSNVLLMPGETLDSHIEDACPIKVYGFARVKADLTVFADRMADCLTEAIADDDEIGCHPNYAYYDAIVWDRAKLVLAIEAAIAPFGEFVKPWPFEVVSVRHYTAAEVMGIVHLGEGAK